MVVGDVNAPGIVMRPPSSSTRYRIGRNAVPLLLSICFCACATLRDVESRPDFGPVDAILADEMENGRIPFAEVLVFRHGKLIYRYRGGHTDAGDRDPLPEHGLYRIASLSKPMTSFVALRLVETGLLDLEAPVSNYLPELSDLVVRTPCDAEQPDSKRCTRPAASAMKVRHLLAHTAGISYPLVDGDELATKYRGSNLTNGAIETDYSLEELPSRIAGLPLAHDPGDGWRYGLATDVLGRLLEVVVGKPLPALMAEYLFAPLGMRDTCFIVAGEARSRLLPIFQIDRDGELSPIGPGPQLGGQFEFSTSFPLHGGRYFSGGGGLVSSASDVGTFIRMLAARGMHDGRILLGPELFREFQRDQTMPFGTGIAGTGFGLGIGVRVARMSRGTLGNVGELSWSGIFFTTFWVDPSTGIAGAFLSQMRPNQRGDAAKRVQNAVFDVLSRE